MNNKTNRSLVTSARYAEKQRTPATNAGYLTAQKRET